LDLGPTQRFLQGRLEGQAGSMGVVFQQEGVQRRPSKSGRIGPKTGDTSNLIGFR
jgi:hypothetical protein